MKNAFLRFEEVDCPVVCLSSQILEFLVSLLFRGNHVRKMALVSAKYGVGINGPNVFKDALMELIISSFV
jgi:hypothetical protein